MKKKLGDLTVRELKKLQKEKCRIYPCRDCPFNHCCIDNKVDLEQEIEVEEDKFKGGNKMNKSIQCCYLPKYDDRIKLISQINGVFTEASYWIILGVNSILSSLPNDLLMVLNEEKYKILALTPKDKLIHLIKFVEERIGDK